MQTEENQLGSESQPLPDELIAEILSRLPVKLLMQFKLVCKSWNSLIRNTDFVKQHLYRCSAPNSSPSVIFVRDKQNVLSFPVKSLLKTPPSTMANESHLLWKLESRYYVVGSCNGLVCLLGTHPLSYARHYCVRFLNPATRLMSQKSPEVPIKPRGYINYPFDGYGFGYDRVSDTYKAVFVPDDRRINQVKVFSMGDTYWRDTGIFPPALISCIRVGAHLNGTLNWLARKNDNDNGSMCDSDSCMIFSFDLNKEQNMTLLLPDTPIKFSHPSLGILGRYLCFAHNENNHYMVWQMKEFGVDRSWTKLLNISTTIHVDGRSLFSSSFPLCMFENGDILMLAQKLLYNQRDKRLQHLKIPKNIYEYDYNTTMATYSESLISPC